MGDARNGRHDGERVRPLRPLAEEIHREVSCQCSDLVAATIVVMAAVGAGVDGAEGQAE